MRPPNPLQSVKKIIFLWIGQMWNYSTIRQFFTFDRSPYIRLHVISYQWCRPSLALGGERMCQALLATSTSVPLATMETNKRTANRTTVSRTTACKIIVSKTTDSSSRRTTTGNRKTGSTKTTRNCLARTGSSLTTNSIKTGSSRKTGSTRTGSSPTTNSTRTGKSSRVETLCLRNSSQRAALAAREGNQAKVQLTLRLNSRNSQGNLSLSVSLTLIWACLTRSKHVLKDQRASKHHWLHQLQCQDRDQQAHHVEDPQQGLDLDLASLSLLTWAEVLVLLLLHRGSQTLKDHHQGANLHRALKVVSESFSRLIFLAEAPQNKSCMASQFWALHVPSRTTNAII